MSEAGNDWKSSFYAAYVSSGQAPDTGEGAEDLFRSRLPHLNHLIDSHMPEARDVRIVDLACGPGSLLYALKRRGYNNIGGVDVSAEQIAVAVRIGIASATCGTIEDFLAAQPDASVDVITAIDILEHLTRPQVMALLGAIRRVLKPGGRCIVQVPNAEGIFAMSIRYGDFTHELAFTRVSATQIFQVAGFREVRCFENRPQVHGAKSLVRRILWEAGTLPTRLLCLAETAAGGVILSQNMTIRAVL